MRDIIREIAESNPIILIGRSVDYCRYCKGWESIGKFHHSDHKEGCTWVYCVEQVKERE